MAMIDRRRPSGALFATGILLLLFTWGYRDVEGQATGYMWVLFGAAILLIGAAVVAARSEVGAFLRVWWLTLSFVAAMLLVLTMPDSWAEALRIGGRIPAWLARVLLLFALQGFAVLLHLANRRRGDFLAERAAAAANVTFLLQVGVGLLVAVNVIASNWLTSVVGSLDTTETGVYSLSDRTKRMLDGLEKLPGDLQATYLDYGSNYRAMPGEEPLGDQGKDYLRQYAEYSPKLRLTVLDAIRDKKEVEEHLRGLGIDDPEVATEDTVIFTYRGPEDKTPKRKDVTVSRWTFMETSALGTRKFKGEGLYTSAIQDVIYPKKKVYFLKGHGEHPLSGGEAGMSEAAEVIRRLALETEELNLEERSQVPDDADLVVVAGPTSPLRDKERDALVAWLEKGGALILMLDPQVSLLSGGQNLVRFGLEEFLASLKIAVKTDHLCMDYDLAFGATGVGRALKTSQILTADYTFHPIVKDLSERELPCRFVNAAPVFVEEAGPGEEPEDGGPKTEELVHVRRNAAGLAQLPTYAARLYPGRNPERDDPDNDIRDKRLPLAAAAMKDVNGPAGKTSMRVVVFGDSDFATTMGLSDRSQYYAPGHATLLSSAVSWAVQREELIAIEPKTLETEKVDLEDREARLAKTVGVYGLPLLVLLLGILVAWQRRR